MATAHRSSRMGGSSLLWLTLGALGVVFGDIGTSPLYALKECFSGEHALPPNPEHVKGVVSLIIWALISVVSLKYLVLVLKADNRGEGGVLALMALALRSARSVSQVKRTSKVFLGLIGAALLYGDGIITPAISVLSAVEGLSVATEVFDPYIRPITIAILVALFFIQSVGTARVGALFGPIIIVWYFTMGALGIPSIIQAPEILSALNPLLGISFLVSHGNAAFLTLGSVFLAVTGTEALYADMGHFGKRPIRLGWFSVAFPGLLLNYLGQGGMLLRDIAATHNPFFMLAPSWMVLPLVVLATLATVIASQALISGAFSLTSQAVQLGYLPRLQIKHTSETEVGQIYIPVVNWLLCLGTLLLVTIFSSSSELAAAYGIAVATTMVITTCLIYCVARDLWRWELPILYPTMGAILVLDLMFFGANIMKIAHGGWIPVLIALVIFTVMTTWWRGRRILWERLTEQVEPFSQFFEQLNIEEYVRVPGTAVFMIRDLNITPPALLYNLRLNRVLHERVVLLTVVAEDVPHLGPDATRIETRDLGGGFHRWIIHHGFMENVDVPFALRRWSTGNLQIDPKDVAFFLDRVIPIPTTLPGMALWRERLFAFMSQNALRATKFYRVPARQVIEIGFQVEI